jgi:hypothetical protein
VLIWLGEAGPATQEALAKLDQIGEVREAGEVHLRSVLSELYQRAREASKELNSYDSSASDLELAKVNEDKDSALQELKKDYLAIFEMENQPLWGGIVDLFSRPYWNRLWIVQEVTLSRQGRVICGSFTSDWEFFHKAARQIHDLGLINKPPPTLHQILTISERRGCLWHKEQEHYKSLIDSITNKYSSCQSPHIEDLRGADRVETTSLSFLLEQFSDSRATDPRDRVFALLSMANTYGLNQLQADYGLTEREVYLKTMSHVLSQERRSSLLEYFAPPSWSHIQGTPSWVPDFRSPRLLTDQWDKPFKEALSTFSGPPIVDGGTLTISGIVYWEIQACTIFISPAEVYHLQSPKPLSAPNIMAFSDIIPPDMSYFILMTHCRPAAKYLKSQQSFQVWESQSLQE